MAESNNNNNNNHNNNNNNNYNYYYYYYYYYYKYRYKYKLITNTHNPNYWNCSGWLWNQQLSTGPRCFKTSCVMWIAIKTGLSHFNKIQPQKKGCLILHPHLSCTMLVWWSVLCNVRFQNIHKHPTSLPTRITNHEYIPSSKSKTKTGSRYLIRYLVRR